LANKSWVLFGQKNARLVAKSSTDKGTKQQVAEQANLALTRIANGPYSINLKKTVPKRAVFSFATNT